jgi:[acyl-carrier-protein] S-malonyltransferase
MKSSLAASVADDQKIAFLFPGQGSQKVGMDAPLRETDAERVDEYLGRADEASGLPVTRLTAEGPIEELTRTDVAQPALFSLSLALADVAREVGLSPDFVAGHSLGEYTAAVVSGSLDPADGLPLVCQRGRLMAELQSVRPGAMAAILGLSAEDVERLCERASETGLVGAANLNSPSQVVVSGEEGAVERLILLAKEAGAKRALRLQVGAAFHSELMTPVRERLGETMNELSWNDPETPLVANWSGETVTSGEEVHHALVTQVASPVRWVECVQTLVDAGCTRFVELGPGRVLTGLVRQIAGDEVEAMSADSPATIEELAAR